MSYSELNVTDRATIQIYLSQGLSLRAIARYLDRSPSTISREVRRNSDSGDGYRAERAQASRLKRRLYYRPKRKLFIDNMNLPKLEDDYVCRETIYTAIYALPVGQLRKELIHCLRQGKSTRKPRRGETDRRGQIPDMVSIHLRPPEVDKREMPGIGKAI